MMTAFIESCQAVTKESCVIRLGKELVCSIVFSSVRSGLIGSLLKELEEKAAEWKLRLSAATSATGHYVLLTFTSQ